MSAQKGLTALRSTPAVSFLPGSIPIGRIRGGICRPTGLCAKPVTPEEPAGNPLSARDQRSSPRRLLVVCGRELFSGPSRKSGHQALGLQRNRSRGATDRFGGRLTATDMSPWNIRKYSGSEAANLDVPRWGKPPWVSRLAPASGAGSGSRLPLRSMQARSIAYAHWMDTVD